MMTTTITQVSIILVLLFYRQHKSSWVKRCIRSHFLFPTVYFLQAKLPHVPITMHMTKVQTVVLSPDSGYQTACVLYTSSS